MLVVIDFVQIYGIFNGRIEIFNQTYMIENSILVWLYCEMVIGGKKEYF